MDSNDYRTLYLLERTRRQDLEAQVLALTKTIKELNDKLSSSVICNISTDSNINSTVISDSTIANNSTNTTIKVDVNDVTIEVDTTRGTTNKNDDVPNSSTDTYNTRANVGLVDELFDVLLVGKTSAKEEIRKKERLVSSLS